MTALVADRYEIVRELDRGGMGEVLLARQLNLNRLVVIKRVLAEHSQEFVTALREEALLAARLHHPNIVSVLDVSEENEPAFVALEYVAGLSLRELVKQSPTGLPVDVALAIAIDVLRGLAYAHEARSGTHAGVVHRDVKPRNVMVTFAGTTKLIDFGISRWLSTEGNVDITSVAGTYGYMAPEQVLKKPLDGRVDQYAAGITLREMLTGAPPDDGEMTAHAKKSTRGTIESELAAIVERATAAEPGSRFATCEELANALAAYAKAHDLDPSAMVVERWMEANFADRIEAWEQDADRASAPTLRPVTVSTVLENSTKLDKPESTKPTVSEGEMSTERPPPVRRRWALIVASVASLAIAGVVVFFATRPPGWFRSERVEAATTIAIAATADEPWLALAVENVARRSLRDVADRRFWIATATDTSATRVELRLRRSPGGLHVDALTGGELVASADGASVYEVVEAVTAPLAAALGKHRDNPGPDPGERVRMTKLGAKSYDQYRRFRILFEQVREPGWFDTTAAIAGYEALVAEDPAWGHPYAELNWVYGRSTKESKAILTAAKAGVDPTRGGGLALIQALDIELQGTIGAAKRALELADAVFRKDNEDMLAGEIVSSAHTIAGRNDEASAINRRLLELYPALFYIGDLSEDLQKQGREAEAEQLIRDTLRKHPESLAGARALVKLEARRGDRKAAQVAAQRMLVIHGQRTLALAELFDAMLASENVTVAQQLADRMMIGSPVSRVRGRYRTALIAVFQGRFSAAYQLAKQVLKEGQQFGTDGEVPQASEIVVSLGVLLGEVEATARFLEERASIVGTRDLNRVSAITWRFDAALLRRGTTCPAIDGFLDGVVGDIRENARRSLRRSAARAGCASCKDVVADGLAPTETSTASLVAFGRCAREVGEHTLARRAFERATSMWSSWNNRQASPFHAMLAHYELARTLAELGDKPRARDSYERFLRAWGTADRVLPEVADAERALAALSGALRSPNR